MLGGEQRAKGGVSDTVVSAQVNLIPSAHFFLSFWKNWLVGVLSTAVCWFFFLRGTWLSVIRTFFFLVTVLLIDTYNLKQWRRWTWVWFWFVIINMFDCDTLNPLICWHSFNTAHLWFIRIKHICTRHYFSCTYVTTVISISFRPWRRFDYTRFFSSLLRLSSSELILHCILLF